MGRNRSLDEFTATSPDAGEGSGDDENTAVPEPGGDDAVEPIAATYAWSPDAGTCDACGEPVAERWRDGDDLVCSACKAW